MRTFYHLETIESTLRELSIVMNKKGLEIVISISNPFWFVNENILDN
jgi:hypothetical protein